MLLEFRRKVAGVIDTNDKLSPLSSIPANYFSLVIKDIAKKQKSEDQFALKPNS
jgi:hypothetical protein